MGLNVSCGCESDTNQKYGVDPVSSPRTISPERRSRMNAAPIGLIEGSSSNTGVADAGFWQEAVMGTDAFCNVQLSHIFPQARFIACDDIVASGCHDDPWQCGPGDVFIARLTAAGDGHELVSHAIARGVAGIVAERIIPTCGTPLCLVPDSAWAQARLLHALAGDPASNLRVIAITGTSGKTTTAWLTASVLSEAGLRVGVLSDLGCLDAQSAEPVAADLEQPHVLATWFGRLASSGCTHAVVEVSSRMLATHALAGIECDTVVVTNMATAHLDAHGTTAAYHTMKSRIVESLSESGCLIANVDDARVRAIAVRRTTALRRGCAVITAGLSVAADISATPVERSLYGQTFLLRAGGHMAPLAVATPVASFVRNCLLAVAVGVRYRVPLEQIARGIEAAGSVPGRVERIDRGHDLAVFVDRPTSGHALATTLSSLRRLTRGRLVLLAEADLAATLGGAARFESRAGRWCDKTIVVPSGWIDSQAGNRAIASYARIDRLLSSLGQHDCVLVLGDMLGNRGDPDGSGEPSFSLPSVVEGWLQLANPPMSDYRQERAA